jgi:UPF0716 family protein affecting phage T7 exclusion
LDVPEYLWGKVIGYQLLANTIEITDMLGCVMLRNEASKTISNIQSSITNIQVEDLSSGVYFIKATVKNGNIKIDKFVYE